MIFDFEEILLKSTYINNVFITAFHIIIEKNSIKITPKTPSELVH